MIKYAHNSVVHPPKRPKTVGSSRMTSQSRWNYARLNLLLAMLWVCLFYKLPGEWKFFSYGQDSMIPYALEIHTCEIFIDPSLLFFLNMSYILPTPQLIFFIATHTCLKLFIFPAYLLPTVSIAGIDRIIEGLHYELPLITVLFALTLVRSSQVMFELTSPSILRAALRACITALIYHKVSLWLVGSSLSLKSLLIVMLFTGVYLLFVAIPLATYNQLSRV